MSDIEKVLTQLGDPEFREKMRKNSDEALKGYQLSDMERILLKEMAKGYATDLQQAKIPGRLSASLKEWGAMLVSVLLLSVLVWVLIQTYGQIASLPQSVKIGDTTQVVDMFARAKDLLSVLFPLFAAVVTFWLGVTVEGKRADDNKETADKESEDRASAEERERTTKANAATMIGELKGHVTALHDVQQRQGVALNATSLDSLIQTLAKWEGRIKS
jgi:CBS domain containing-hemolysin-like protein